MSVHSYENKYAHKQTSMPDYTSTIQSVSLGVENGIAFFEDRRKEKHTILSVKMSGQNYTDYPT